jgi:hypothetical protein
MEATDDEESSASCCNSHNVKNDKDPNKKKQPDA